MIKKLQHIFALSEEGCQRPGEGRDLVLCVQSGPFMFPWGVLFTVQHLLGCLEGGGSPMDGFWIYVALPWWC